MNYNEAPISTLQAWIEKLPVESWHYHLSMISDEERRNLVRGHLMICLRLMKDGE